jgi:hypothetical protein
MNELLLTALTASLWCLGLWSITQPGKLLSFLRQPFMDYIDKRETGYRKQKENLIVEYQQLQAVANDDIQRNIYREQLKKRLEIINAEAKHFKLSMKLLNPVILCPVCMGSIHGLLTFSMFYPISWWVVPVMIVTSGLNKVWHEKIF